MASPSLLRPLGKALIRTRLAQRALAMRSLPAVCSASPASTLRHLSSAQPIKEEEASPSNPFVVKEDIKKLEQKRQRLSEVLISDVLRAKHTLRWVDPIICRTDTVQEAVKTCIDGGLSGMMVVDSLSSKKVAGLTTSRDLLRIIAAGIRDGDSPETIMSRQIGDFMTPISQVVFARPHESIGICRAIMAKLGIKCLPILSKNGQVEGLITAKDMADYGLEATDKGGKKSFLRDISERVGLSSSTSMAEPPAYLSHMALDQTPLYINVSVAELPHPFKTDNGCGMNHREFGLRDYSTDPEWSEDAHFFSEVELPDESGNKLRPVTYMGVADGVGSWREYNVDPREFSSKLMAECENVIVESASNAKLGGGKFRRTIAPAEVLAQAYERVKAENVIGSSTACVALFDNVRHQLHFSNLGDSGIIVLRHIDSDVAGSLKRDKQVPRSDRKSDLRVAFVSQQQLKSFNHPFQLGWTGEELKEGESSSFKTAKDSCTTSIHVRRGDIIVMATDGLFDNVDVEEIASIALEWEQKKGFIRGGDIIAREKRWAMGNSLTVLSHETLPDFTQQLVLKARENSLDTSLDSPFAILAKENDIMWSGGMPDDCTVVAMHVVGRRHDDLMDKDHQ